MKTFNYEALGQKITSLAKSQDLHPLDASDQLGDIYNVVKRLACRAEQVGDFQASAELYETLAGCYHLAADSLASEWAAVDNTVRAAGCYWDFRAGLAISKSGAPRLHLKPTFCP